ncbi:MAG TPA: DUF1778 domain-containing protein [Terriglobales bacterium]|jgi:uncharacterized protein (DUF1778 family)|nr:DUF1778 domain-containing protein [Terriglobales bacterium]
MQDNKNRSSVLVRCSEEEARKIRDAAKHERRTISAYVLNVVMGRIKNLEQVVHKMEGRSQRREA